MYLYHDLRWICSSWVGYFPNNTAWYGCEHTVTYVRSPCPNNVNFAVTIDSAELLQFRSNATMKTNASSQQWKQSLYATMKHASGQQSKQKTWHYGYGDAIEIGGDRSQYESWSLKREDIARILVSSTICCLCVLRVIISGCISEGLAARRHYTHFRCNPRICRTCVRILEELLIVINSCVLNLECNKLPSWLEPSKFVTIHMKALFPLFRKIQDNWMPFKWVTALQRT
jgi:hypothetical protein